MIFLRSGSIDYHSVEERGCLTGIAKLFGKCYNKSAGGVGYDTNHTGSIDSFFDKGDANHEICIETLKYLETTFITTTLLLQRHFIF